MRAGTLNTSTGHDEALKSDSGWRHCESLASLWKREKEIFDTARLSEHKTTRDQSIGIAWGVQRRIRAAYRVSCSSVLRSVGPSSLRVHVWPVTCARRAAYSAPPNLDV